SECYNKSPANRLEEYMSVNFELIESELPDWHLTHYLEPNISKVEIIPHLLHRLSTVRLPTDIQSDKSEFFRRSFNGYRRGTDHSNKFVYTDNQNEIKKRITGWLTDDIPIDSYKLLPVAYKNHLNFVENDLNKKRITVILNDLEMEAEGNKVTQVYEQQGEDLSVEIHYRKGLSTVELAEAFEENNNLIHYVGHCKNDGLNCPNGYLDISTIDESNAETFVLNACSSYVQGRELIKKGSVAGVVTIHDVVDSQAASVGKMFGRLLINGFSVQQALEMARNQIMLNKKYLVIGDGTHSIFFPNQVHPLKFEIEEISEERYIVQSDIDNPKSPGSSYKPDFKNKLTSHIGGKVSYFELDRKELLSQLRNYEFPVKFKDTYYWSNELIEKIQ
ncbi:MAG: hypothetical protein ABEH43_04370, partial [Flavobacteriales bacterium]